MNKVLRKVWKTAVRFLYEPWPFHWIRLGNGWKTFFSNSDEQIKKLAMVLELPIPVLRQSARRWVLVINLVAG